MAIFQVVDCDNTRENFTGANSTTITLGGAAGNAHPFSLKYAAGDTFVGTARGISSGEESTGFFTYNGTTVTQTEVWKSSNANAAVSFSLGGPCEIFVDPPGRWFDELNLRAITVASATTCDIGAAQAGKIIISGTTTITSLGTTAHKRRFVHFSGAMTLTYNATSLILPGGANISTSNGDTAAFMSDSSGNWRCYFYQYASGQKITGPLVVAGLTTSSGVQVTNVAQAKLQLTAASGSTSTGFSFGRSISGGDTNDFFIYDQTNAGIRFTISNAGAVAFPGVSTTASAANAFLDGAASNNLLRSTSSLRYKKDVEPIEDKYADAILNLLPIWYRSKAEADNPEWGWYGLGAEDVAKIDPRLVHWSYADDAYEMVDVEIDVPEMESVEEVRLVIDGDVAVRKAVKSDRPKFKTIPVLLENGEPNMVQGEGPDGELALVPEFASIPVVTKGVRQERRLKQGAVKVPDSVQYDRIAVLLLSVVKRMHAKR